MRGGWSELEHQGVLHRPHPPAYELTAWGRDLEPIVLALGGWALRQVPVPDGPLHLSPVPVLLFLRGTVRSHTPLTLRVDLDDTVWTVHTSATGATVRPGEPDSPDASLTIAPLALNDLIAAGLGPALDHALTVGSATAGGNLSALRCLTVTPAPG